MRIPVASALIAVALIVAGCGGGGGGGRFTDKSGDDMARAAAQDMKDLHSMRVVGYLRTGGQRVQLNVSMATNGDCAGTLVVQDGSADLVIVHGNMWIRPDAAFLDIGSPGKGTQLKRLIGDRWIAESDEQLQSICDLDDLMKSFRDIASGQDPQATVIGPGQVGSTDAVRLQGIDQGQTFLVWVATTAPHHVLRMDMRGGRTPGTVKFTDFDIPVKVHAPLPSEVVNLSGTEQG